MYDFSEYTNNENILTDISFFNDNDSSALWWLVSDIGMNIEEAVERVDEVIIFTGSPEEYGRQWVAETYSNLPTIIENNIDFSAIANELGSNGDVVELDCGIRLVVNANAF